MSVENCVGNVRSENYFMILNNRIKFLFCFDVVGCSNAGSHAITYANDLDSGMFASLNNQLILSASS